MKNLKFVIAILAIVTLGGCTSASRAKIGAMSKSHTITLYSGGKAVRTWKSTGIVVSEANSDGYNFQDSVSGKLVTVSGDVVIEVE